MPRCRWILASAALPSSVSRWSPPWSAQTTCGQTTWNGSEGKNLFPQVTWSTAHTTKKHLRHRTICWMFQLDPYPNAQVWCKHYTANSKIRLCQMQSHSFSYIFLHFHHPKSNSTASSNESPSVLDHNLHHACHQLRCSIITISPKANGIGFASLSENPLLKRCKKITILLYE